MATRDWQPYTNWGLEEQAAFRAKLKRVRTWNRATYIGQQASALWQTGKPDLMDAALGLIDEIIANSPDDYFIASVHQSRAQYLIDLGRPEEALQALRQALESRRAHPNHQPEIHLDFAELVLALGKRELYEECEAILSEFGDEALFPASIYRLAAARALLADARGDRSTASVQARLALGAAAQTESPFRYHRKLGLVKTVDPMWQAKLEALGAA